MQIKSNVNNKTLMILLEGRLDTVTSPQLEEEINQYSFDEINNVLLDLKELEYISSAGLRVLLKLYKKMLAQGGEVRIINVNNVVMDIFDMTGMSNFLNIEKA